MNRTMEKSPKIPEPTIDNTIQRRINACISLEKSMKHLPLGRIIYILTFNMSIEKLEEEAKFQDRD